MHTNFVAHIRAHVETYGDTRSYTYVREQGGRLTEQVVTYAQLDREARAIAAWLSRQPGAEHPVLLLYADGIDFLPAFLGCLYAGVVAVPAPLPHDARSLHRVSGMFDDADIRLVLTTAAYRDLLTTWIDQNQMAARVSCVATDSGVPGDPADWRMPELDQDTVAFLQYTSGSTSEPKGVVVTHGNLLHNETGITALVDIDDTSTVVGWLPHFHDMGLIGMLLQPIYAGANLAFMSPLAFLKRPHRWLELIDRYRAAATVAPNFAYDLVSRRVTDAQLAGLDLSSLRVALNGAEPIRARTLEAVIERLGPVGFRPDAFLTCYGMAEVTLLATGSRSGTPAVHFEVDAAALERHEVRPAGADGGLRLVSSGRAVDLDVRIVDPHTHQVLPEHRVGEIWIRGESVAAGYWNRTQETEEKFHARTADGQGPYLRTGDLGFFSGGELFVTGRLKDLLIVNGRNLYPQDIEEMVRTVHPALAEAPGVVFSVEAGREQIVVIQGTKSSLLDGITLPELTARVKGAVARAFEVPAPNVVLVERGGVHRTTSGKVQRRSMQASFLANRVEDLLHEDIDPTVQRLRATV